MLLNEEQLQHSYSDVALDKMRIALVHDWLNGRRGGEKVLEELCAIWPQSEIHTLFYEPQRMPLSINRHCVHPSFLQKFPLTRRYYRYLLPLFPMAMRKMNPGSCDAVISISHCAAKAAPVPEGIPHLCYCLTPARYFYDQSDSYFKHKVGPLRAIRELILKRLRAWDQQTAKQVTEFIAISKFVAERIRQTYDREAQVIYPPVDTDFYTTAPDIQAQNKKDFFVIVSAAVPYKRLDIAIDAFNAMSIPLIVIGKGPQLPKLQQRAKPNIKFQTWIGRSELRELYREARGFIFTAEEDFGITPVEAQACGCPVIAYARGGTAETVIDGKTGILYPEQSAESLMQAIEMFQSQSFDTLQIRDNAERFSRTRFCKEFTEAAEKLF